MRTTSTLRNLLNKKEVETLEMVKRKSSISCNQKLLKELIDILKDIELLPRPLHPNRYAYLLTTFDVLYELIPQTLKFDYTELLTILEKSNRFIEQQLIENEHAENYSGKFQKYMVQLQQKIGKTEEQLCGAIKHMASVDEHDSYNLLHYLIFEFRNYDFVVKTFEQFPQLFEIDALNNNHFMKQLMDAYFTEIHIPNNLGNVIYFQKIIEYFIDCPCFHVTKQYRDKLVQKLVLQEQQVHDSLVVKEQIDRIVYLLQDLIGKLKKRKNSHDEIESLNYRYGIMEKYHVPIIPCSSQTLKKTPVLDCRHLYTVTIDRLGTQSFDDALSFEKLENGNYRFSVYISDVVTYLQGSKSLENYAYRLGSNIYLPKHVIMILPYEYTFQICSLRAGIDHYVLAYQFEFTKDFTLLTENCQVVPAMIRVDENLSFQDLDWMIASSQDTGQLNQLKGMLQVAETLRKENNYKEFYHAYKEAKRQKGGLDAEDLTLEYDMVGARLVQEAKILANTFVAQHFYQQKLPFLWRNNTLKEKEKMITLVRMMAHQNPKLEDIISFMEGFFDCSYYSAVNEGHSGLFIPAYAHSTTPIRNSAAITNQKLIHQFMLSEHYTDQDIEYWQQCLPQQAENLNQRIHMNNQYKAEYMELYRQKQKRLDK